MKRRLATLAGAALCVFVLGAAPALAAGSADRWVVVESDSVDLAPLNFSFQCGDNSYVVVSGTLDFVWLMSGSLTAEGIAVDAGHGIETWTLRDARVVDQDSRIHRVVGSERVNALWPAGADVMGDPGGPFRSAIWIENVRIQGTGDGRSLVMHQLHDGTFRVVDSGTCTGLALHV